MIDPAIFALLPSLIYLGIETMLTCFLIYRSRQRKLSNLLLLSAGYMVDVVALLLNLFQFQWANFVPDAVEPYLGTASFGMRGVAAIAVAGFTVRTFYQRKASPFKLFAIIITGITAVIIGINVLNINLPLLDANVLHFCNMPGVFLVTLLGFSWLSHSARVAIRQVAGDRLIEPWIVKRYQLVSACAIFPILTAIPPIFLLPPLYQSSLAAVVYMSLAIMQGIFVIGSAMCWMTPSAVKARWNKGFSRSMDAAPVSPEGTYTKQQSVYIIEKLGDLLAGLINKGASACKGLIYLSIEQTLGEGAISRLNIVDLLNVIRSNLAKQLDLFHLLGTSEIEAALESEAVRLQSAITMEGV